MDGQQLGYRPALDGVRGLAVLAVIGVHAWPGLLPNGWVGVDVFFVLSGFLITTLLLAERVRTGALNLAGFYGRRARRLLPALLLAIVVVLLSTWLLPGLRGLTEPATAWQAVAATAFAGNWYLTFAHQPPGYGLFGHTWSLGVEEQFYLVWPLLLLALLRLGRRRAAWIAVALVVLVAVHRATAGTLTQSFRTDLRADSLLVGCALALFAARGVRPGRRLATLWGWVGGVALLGIAMLPGSAGWLEHSSLMYRGGFTAVALLGAGLVAAAVHAPSRLLLSRPVVYVGKVSYGVYLWHFPIAVVAAEAFGNGFGNATGFFTGLGLYATSLGLGLLVASLSYRYVEAPLRRARLQRRVAAVAAAA